MAFGLDPKRKSRRIDREKKRKEGAGEDNAELVREGGKKNDDLTHTHLASHNFLFYLNDNDNNKKQKDKSKSWQTENQDDDIEYSAKNSTRPTAFAQSDHDEMNCGCGDRWIRHGTNTTLHTQTQDTLTIINPTLVQFSFNCIIILIGLSLRRPAQLVARPVDRSTLKKKTIFSKGKLSDWDILSVEVHPTTTTTHTHKKEQRLLVVLHSKGGARNESHGKLSVQRETTNQREREREAPFLYAYSSFIFIKEWKIYKRALPHHTLGCVFHMWLCVSQQLIALISAFLSLLAVWKMGWVEDRVTLLSSFIFFFSSFFLFYIITDALNKRSRLGVILSIRFET